VLTRIVHRGLMQADAPVCGGAFQHVQVGS
jgi:hypothetical protein